MPREQVRKGITIVNLDSVMRYEHTHGVRRENALLTAIGDPVGGVFPHGDPWSTAVSFFVTPVQK